MKEDARSTLMADHVGDPPMSTSRLLSFGVIATLQQLLDSVLKDRVFNAQMPVFPWIKKQRIQDIRSFLLSGIGVPSQDI